MVALGARHRNVSRRHALLHRRVLRPRFVIQEPANSPVRLLDRHHRQRAAVRRVVRHINTSAEDERRAAMTWIADEKPTLGERVVNTVWIAASVTFLLWLCGWLPNWVADTLSRVVP